MNFGPKKNNDELQAKAFKPVIEGKSCIIADQSGSGKTLAYLAPLVQCLREEEIQEVSKFLPRSPRVIIMVPTAELASQVSCFLSLFWLFDSFVLIFESCCSASIAL